MIAPRFESDPATNFHSQVRDRSHTIIGKNFPREGKSGVALSTWGDWLPPAALLPR